ncbi:peptidylprolyl isomerase [Gemmatimonadota bacterium]
MIKFPKYLLLFSSMFLLGSGCSQKEDNPHLYNVNIEQLTVKPVPTEEEILKVESEARKVLEEIRSGGDFSEAAKKHSTHSSASQGGELDLTKGWMNPLFDEVVFKMENGSLSDIIHAQEAVYIVYRISSEYLQARSSHILIKAGDKTMPEEWRADEETARRKAWEMYKRVKNGESFYELAREHSDDPGSAQNGGDIGWNKRNTLEKAYEEVAFSQEPGEISEPVKTRFGYHVIRTVKKKDHTLKIKLIQFEVPVGRNERLEARKAIEEARRQAMAGIELKVLSERFAGNPKGLFVYNAPYNVRKNQLIPELAAQVDKTDEGEVSEVLESGKNYYFIKLIEK